MSLPPVLETVLDEELMRSPEPQSAVFSPSRRSSGDETLMGDEPEEKAKPVPVRRHTRFRSATVAVDNAAANFARYKRGKDKKGKGECSSLPASRHRGS